VKLPKIRLVLVAALLALVIVFILQNVATVEVQFLFWGFVMPRSLLVFTVLLVGVIAGWVLRAALHRSKS